MPPKAFSSIAPRILGALFLVTLTTLTSCTEKDPAPWEGETIKEETEAVETATPDKASQPTEKASLEPRSKEGETEAIRFLSYNLKNWLTMDRYVDRKPVGSTPKPEEERDAVVAIIADSEPDLLGVCEVGTTDDLADLQERLKQAGIDLPYSHHAGGVDDTRRLGFLSRFPFSATKVHEPLDYELEGQTRGMGRGILDVSVETPIGEIRFLGAHLKSKREIPEADQALIRLAEAHLLRQAAEAILEADPGANLIVYGDMNDMRQAPALRAIQGPRSGDSTLKMVHIRDSRGDSWTHHWSYQDVYSRFDYVLISPPLIDRMTWDECRVLDPDNWRDASDHRALLVVIE